MILQVNKKEKGLLKMISKDDYWILEEDNDSWKWIIDKEKLIDEIIEEVYRRG